MSGTLRPGDRVGDKYVIAGEIGSGGMGVVYVAEHLVLRTRVAVKVLLPEALSAPDAVERFLREARSAAVLRSQHVARVLDVGTTGEMPYLIMEHLEGCDLRQTLRQRGRLPVGESADYLVQICDAVSEAHRNGIVHRDLKPANIFVTVGSNGAPLLKVLDFGLARVIDPSAAGLKDNTVTATGEIIGSPHYMSPEQFRSLRLADARSDIWALGVIAYELLCGHRPFSGEGLTGVMASILQDEPIPPRALVPEIPPDVEALILGCLAKRPDARFQSVPELVDILAPYVPVPARPSRASLPDQPAPMSTWVARAQARGQLPPARASQPGWPTPSSNPGLPPTSNPGLPRISNPGLPPRPSHRGLPATPSSPGWPPPSNPGLTPPLSSPGLPATPSSRGWAPEPFPSAARPPQIQEGPPDPDTTAFGQSSTGHLATKPAGRAARWLIVVAASSVLAVCFLLVWKAWLAPARSPTVAATTPPLVQGTSLPSSSETREAPAPPSPPPSSSSLDPEQPADRPPDAPPSAPVAGDLPGPKGTTDRSKKGALNINAAPQASVLLDGKPVGRTPQIGLPVDPGKHTVVFVFADGRQKKQTVIVGPGQTVTAVAWDDPTGGVVTPGFN